MLWELLVVSREGELIGMRVPSGCKQKVEKSWTMLRGWHKASRWATWMGELCSSLSNNSSRLAPDPFDLFAKFEDRSPG